MTNQIKQRKQQMQPSNTNIKKKALTTSGPSHPLYPQYELLPLEYHEPPKISTIICPKCS